MNYNISKPCYSSECRMKVIKLKVDITDHLLLSIGVWSGQPSAVQRWLSFAEMTVWMNNIGLILDVE